MDNEEKDRNVILLHKMRNTPSKMPLQPVLTYLRVGIHLLRHREDWGSGEEVLVGGEMEFNEGKGCGSASECHSEVLG